MEEEIDFFHNFNNQLNISFNYTCTCCLAVLVAILASNYIHAYLHTCLC